MKKQPILALLVVAIALLLAIVGCKKDDDLKWNGHSAPFLFQHKTGLMKGGYPSTPRMITEIFLEEGENGLKKETSLTFLVIPAVCIDGHAEDIMIPGPFNKAEYVDSLKGAIQYSQNLFRITCTEVHPRQAGPKYSYIGMKEIQNSSHQKTECSPEKITEKKERNNRLKLN